MTLQQELQYLYSEITSNDTERQLTAVSLLRTQFLTNDNSRIQNVTDHGFVSILVQLLSSSNQKIQYESLCALTAITFGTLEQKKAVVNNGAVPKIIELLESPSNDVKEQAVWVLGNISSDCVEHRDLLINANILDKLLPIVTEPQITDETRRKATWTLANLCKGDPKPNFAKLQPALYTLVRLLFYVDTEVILPACIAFSMLSDGPGEQIQSVIECGVSRRIVELLMHTDSSIQHAALKTVGNICSGDDVQTQIIINVSALPCLLALLLYNPKKEIVKDACWTISNITAGNSRQIQAVIDADIVLALINRLNSEKDLDIKREALFAILNALTGGTTEQIMYLMEQGCVKPVCDMLGSKIEKSIELQGLKKIINNLRQYKPDYPIFDLLEESGVLDKIDKLQSHQMNKKIQRLAISLAKECCMDSCDEG